MLDSCMGRAIQSTYAHSAGGLVVRLYASMYPDEVVGMVLLHSTHEDVWLRFKEALTPAQWAEFEALTVTNQKLLDAYPEAERWYTAPLAEDATTGQVRQSRANAPLRPMPLVVLAHGIVEDAPPVALGFARPRGCVHPACNLLVLGRDDRRWPLEIRADRLAAGERGRRRQRGERYPRADPPVLTSGSGLTRRQYRFQRPPQKFTNEFK